MQMTALEMYTRMCVRTCVCVSPDFSPGFMGSANNLREGRERDIVRSSAAATAAAAEEG